MVSIHYVHGFGASDHSFTWLQHQLPEHNPHFFLYNNHESVATCIDRLVDQVRADPEPVVLVGHSLGGVIARATAGQCSNVKQLVTMCAPFGGLPHAGMIYMFNGVPVFRELRSYSSLLIDIRAAKLDIPHLAIVGTSGMPIMREANDGAVTVASQTALPDQDYSDHALNHFEVLLSPHVASNINEFLLATG
jgi:pimeloyl-ACP methyl ester carboxylesterase